MRPSKWFNLLLLFTAAVLVVALGYVFMIVPNERVMGPVQRIFYFHVSSAVASYFAIATAFFSAAYYLYDRNWKADVVLEAAGEVALVLCTLVLASGMIWGHAAWNTFFEWKEPRLTSFLLLWFIMLTLNLVRHFGDPARVAAHSAVLAIVGSLIVPVVVFSVKILSQTEQLHPQVLENEGLKDPRYVTAFLVTLLGMTLLQGLLVWLRARIGFVRRSLTRA